MKFDLNDQKRQVSSLLYAMGYEAENTLESFRPSDDEQKSYEIVRGKVESYFVKKRNIIFLPHKLHSKKTRGRASGIFRQ